MDSDRNAFLGPESVLPNFNTPHKLAVAACSVVVCRPDAPWAGLSSSARSVLAYVILHAPARAAYRAAHAVWAFKSSIASAVGLGERTVYRCLAELTAAGWVEVLDQDRRNVSGRFHSARVVLTDLALAALGLSSRSAVLAAGHKEVIPSTKVQQDQSLQRQPGGAGARGKPEHQGTDSGAVAPGAVPSDLAWLLSRGMSRAGVFSLMKLYSRAGKRLGLAVAAMQVHLSKLDARGLFAYLRSLVSKDLDFAAVLSVQQAEVAEKAAEQAARNVLDALRECRLLRRVSDGMLFSVASGFVSMPDGGVLPVNGRLADRVMAGDWEIVE